MVSASLAIRTPLVHLRVYPVLLWMMTFQPLVLQPQTVAGQAGSEAAEATAAGTAPTAKTTPATPATTALRMKAFIDFSRIISCWENFYFIFQRLDPLARWGY